MIGGRVWIIMLETKLSEKPYTFVPLQPVERHERISQNAQLRSKTETEAKLVSGILSFKCRVLTPLHIGNGKLRISSAENNGELVMLHPTVSYQGNPVIPGSSFKGMLRSVYETLTNSCMVFSPAPKNDYLKNGMPQSVQETCRSNKEACAACAVFGSLGWRGKIRIPDLELVEGKIEEIYIPTLKSPFTDYPVNNKNRGNARLYYAHEGNDGLDPDHRRPQPHFGDMTKADFYKKFGWNKGPDIICFYGRKFYKFNTTKPQAGQLNAWRKVQAVTAGSVFRGEIVIEGLSELEWGAILIALGLGHDNWHHQIGQGKPAYYGTVKLHEFFFQPATRFGESKQNGMSSENLRNIANLAINSLTKTQQESLMAMTSILCNTNAGPAWKEIEGNTDHLYGY
jgi:CRISPR/Cas system CSM-associated protein Csm3 (group 7 of RAMP superfamily)